jgi:hypothetical protein
MSKAQFRAALERHGMKPEGFMGYVDLGIPGHRICCSRLNAGSNRRAQLAYLLRERDRNEARIAGEKPSQSVKREIERKIS